MRDILFWSTEIGTAIFWAALAAAVLRPVLERILRREPGAGEVEA